MARKNLDVIKHELGALFAAGPYDDQSITVTERVNNHGQYTGYAKVKRMYEYVDIQFATMMRLRDIFGGEFSIDQWSSGGCETCDYGSSYVKEFVFERKEVDDAAA